MTLSITEPAKVAIIGAGTVGAETAYSLVLRSICTELLIVDTKTDIRDGQVRDLSDAATREDKGTHVRAGTYKEAGQCDVVVITTGSMRMMGGTSTAIIYQNLSILRTIIHSMRPFQKDAILVLVSKPVDLLTQFAQELSGLPASQVLGCGTCLDSIRLRELLAAKVGVEPNIVDAYVLGEHGHSQFVAWSNATIGGAPIEKALHSRGLHRKDLEEISKHEEQHTIERKGAIGFGIASVVSGICASVLLNKQDVTPISHFQAELGCCLSLPVILGRKGIVKSVTLQLSSDEKAKLESSAKSLRTMADRIRDDIFSDPY